LVESKPPKAYKQLSAGKSQNTRYVNGNNKNNNINDTGRTGRKPLFGQDWLNLKIREESDNNVPIAVNTIVLLGKSVPFT
jgi:hypothetical protein